MTRRAIALFVLVAGFMPAQAQSVPTPIPPSPASSDLTPSILADLQAGIASDPAALQRAIASLRELLAQQPRNARALAWSGIASATEASRRLETGKDWNAIADWERGVDQLHQAVALAPDDVVARLGRGKLLSETAVHDPDPTRSADAARLAAEDLEAALTKSKEDEPLAVMAWDRARVHAWLASSYKKLAKPELEKLHREKASSLEGKKEPRNEPGTARPAAESLALRVILLAASDDLSKSLLADLDELWDSKPGALQRVRERVRLVREGKAGDASALTWGALADWRESSQMFSRGRTPQAVTLSEGVLPALNKAIANDPRLALARAVRACHQIEQATYHPDPDAKAAAIAHAALDADALLEHQRGTANSVLRARVHLLQNNNDAARTLLNGAIQANDDPKLVERARAMLQKLNP